MKKRTPKLIPVKGRTPDDDCFRVRFTVHGHRMQFTIRTNDRSFAMFRARELREMMLARAEKEIKTGKSRRGKWARAERLVAGVLRETYKHLMDVDGRVSKESFRNGIDTLLKLTKAAAPARADPDVIEMARSMISEAGCYDPERYTRHHWCPAKWLKPSRK